MYSIKNIPIVFAILAGWIIGIQRMLDLGSLLMFESRLKFCLLFLGCVGYTLLILGIVHFRKLFRLFQNYFSAQTHPLNLSIFRIVIFAYIYLLNFDYVVFYSQIPKDLMFPIYGWFYLMRHLIIDPNLTLFCIVLIKITSLMAMIGYKTNIAAGITAFLCFYLLGIPQFFGKVSHVHHLVWFTSLLALSPCADAFSVDRILSKNKKKLRPSVIYALPIRFSWLLMGVVYFWAGYWKWAMLGIDFSFSDNLINHIYLKWVTIPSWEPFIRIDRYPWMYQWGGLATILFEMLFIFFIFMGQFWRRVVVFGGLMFHNLNWLILNISFISLQIAYVCFIDWYGLLVKFNLVKKSDQKEEGANIDVSQTKGLLHQLLIGMACLFIIGNCYYGMKLQYSWPCSMYPVSPSAIGAKTVKDIQFVPVDGQGRIIDFNSSKVQKGFTPERYFSLIMSVLDVEDKEEQKKRFVALWSVYAKYLSELSRTKTLYVYQLRHSLNPADKAKNPIEKALYQVIQIP